MPELPEVETVVRDLKEIEGCKVVFNKVFEHIDSIRKTPIFKLDGFIIENIKRYGKYIIIKFEKSSYLIHLGMSGKLLLDKGDVLIPNHCHWLIQLDSGWQIRFIDHRRFGNLWHMSNQECIRYVGARLGPEPFSIDPISFILRIKQPKYINRPIKAVLLDQQLVAGLGNIYASEACSDAYIHPKKLISELTDKQLEQILYSSRKVLEKGIKNNGTTFRDYRNAKNQSGNNQNYLIAYKQKTCFRCKSEIVKDKIEDRTTFWCPTCQKE